MTDVNSLIIICSHDEVYGHLTPSPPMYNSIFSPFHYMNNNKEITISLIWEIHSLGCLKN